MVTSRLLEAFLACPVKCHLLAMGEIPAGTEYSAWAAAREEPYRRDGIQKLTSQGTILGIASPDPSRWKYESWRFAVAENVRAQGWEAEVALSPDQQVSLYVDCPANSCGGAWLLVDLMGSGGWKNSQELM